MFLDRRDDGTSEEISAGNTGFPFGDSTQSGLYVSGITWYPLNGDFIPNYYFCRWVQMDYCHLTLHTIHMVMRSSLGVQTQVVDTW